MTDDKKDYKVGWGKPPTGTQFKKGKSGNPEGARLHIKRKSPPTLREMAISAANENVYVMVGGQRKKMTKKEALVKSLINDAITASPTHRLKILETLNKLGVFDAMPRNEASNAEARRKFIEKLAAEARREMRAPHNVNLLKG